MFDGYLHRWDLQPDGPPIVTHSSHLLPVRHGGLAAMLKVTSSPEEVRGGHQLAWWDGVGAARVLASHGGAFLLERAEGTAALPELAWVDDDAATRILCGVAARLHAPRAVPPRLEPLELRFASLAGAVRFGGFFATAHDAAAALLADPVDVVPLHGDLHHGNILDFGPRGWLAIDPKGVVGERTFDFANILCNPDAKLVLTPGRLARQADVIAREARLDRERLLRWVVAWCGLSAAWHVEDGDREAASLPLIVGAHAINALR